MSEETEQVEELETPVVVTGLEIPFWDLVFFLVKLVFAAIPAAFFVVLIFSVMAGVLQGLVA